MSLHTTTNKHRHPDDDEPSELQPPSKIPRTNTHNPQQPRYAQAPPGYLQQSYQPPPPQPPPNNTQPTASNTQFPAGGGQQQQQYQNHTNTYSYAPTSTTSPPIYSNNEHHIQQQLQHLHEKLKREFSDESTNIVANHYNEIGV